MTSNPQFDAIQGTWDGFANVVTAHMVNFIRGIDELREHAEEVAGENAFHPRWWGLGAQKRCAPLIRDKVQDYLANIDEWREGESISDKLFQYAWAEIDWRSIASEYVWAARDAEDAKLGRGKR